MKRSSPKVKAEYFKYEELLKKLKLTHGSGIYVSEQKRSHKDWKISRLTVEHIAYPDEISSLHTEVNCHEKQNFKFLLFAHDFMPEPLVNYDSRGATHRNKGNVPFTSQSITTPHFNRYSQNGHRYAYKTDALSNPTALAELRKINNCIIHFYNEFNIRHIPADYPSIYLHEPSQHELFSTPAVDDLLAYVVKF